MASKTIKIAVSAILLVILIAIAAYITVSRLMIKLADNDFELPKGYENRTKEELNAWLEWKGKTDRSYYCDKNANLQRQGIFISNLRYIKSFNNRNRSFKLAPNKFADMTNEEINKLYIGPMVKWSTVLLPLGDPAQFQINADRNDGVKGPVDWASKSSFVHDQGMCRAGAAYAAAANIESYYNLVNRTSGAKEFKISMQQMLDCLLVGNKDSAPVCSGGVSSVSVYETLEQMTGEFVDEETFNSYLSSLPANNQLTPNCFVNMTMYSAKQQTDIGRSKVLSFGVIDKGNITEALRVLGPLTVGIDASRSSFHFYDSGIYYDDSCDTSSFNHHMLIVGHTEGSSQNDNQAELTTSKKLQQAHYLMKNSFGQNWGEKGFIRFLIDKQANKCLPQGIATYPNLSA